MTVCSTLFLVLIHDTRGSFGNPAMSFEYFEASLPLFFSQLSTGGRVEVCLIEEILQARVSRILLHFEEGISKIFCRETPNLLQLGAIVLRVIF
jgi:hypothetical protein